jgi:repressor LexA
MAELKNILKKLRAEKEMSQASLAKELKAGVSTVASWEVGKRFPSRENMEQLADIFNVDLAYLYGETEIRQRIHIDNDGNAMVSINDVAVKIPVLGRVAAGIPINAITEIEDTEEIPRKLAKTGDFFALKIKGDSMEPKISNGDVVIVRQQDDAETGDIVIAMVNGDDAVCKRLRKYKEGLELISTNPNYAPIYFDDDTIKTKPVRIIGKVVELRAKF